jgi:hypothetical protein
MTKWKLRIKTAWDVLLGRKCLLTTATQQIIYVHSSGPDGKIVQLVPWRDQILALDNNGSILLIDADSHAIPYIQLWMKEPRVGG